MHTVAIRLSAAAFSEEMKAMRVWLDERKLQPSIFEYQDVGNYLAVKVSFKARAEAEIFEKKYKVY